MGLRPSGLCPQILGYPRQCFPPLWVLIPQEDCTRRSQEIPAQNPRPPRPADPAWREYNRPGFKYYVSLPTHVTASCLSCLISQLEIVTPASQVKYKWCAHSRPPAKVGRMVSDSCRGCPGLGCSYFENKLMKQTGFPKVKSTSIQTLLGPR